MVASTLLDRGIKDRATMQLEAGTVDPWLLGVTDYQTSDQELENYPFYGNVPKMTEVKGREDVDRLETKNLQIVNKKFAANLEVEGDILRRNKTGQLRQKIADLGVTSDENWHDLGVEFIAEGETRKGYDKVNFFAANHPAPKGGVVQSNIHTQYALSSATNPTPPELANSILTGIKHLLKHRDNTNRPMNRRAKKFLVFSSIDMMESVEKAINQQLLVTAAGQTEDNFLKNISRIQIDYETSVDLSDYAPWATQFAIFRTDGPTKALIRQDEWIRIMSLITGSDWEFHNDSWLYKVKASRNMGYGAWQNAQLVKLSTDPQP